MSEKLDLKFYKKNQKFTLHVEHLLYGNCRKIDYSHSTRGVDINYCLLSLYKVIAPFYLAASADA